MNLPIPEGQYIQKIDILESSLEVAFASRKKVALVFISLNDRYWPYLSQVIKDCRKHFLPQHNVDYFAWTDYDSTAKEKILAPLKEIAKDPSSFPHILNAFTQNIRLYEYFYPEDVKAHIENLAQKGLFFKRDGTKYWVDSNHQPTHEDTQAFVDILEQLLSKSYGEMDEALKDVKLVETGAVQWPAPTLMRYHLFLNEEEKLKDYDYIFYLDADMRVVSKVSDEILNDGLMAAEHPMYSLRREYIPPYEPNPNSTAYINRPGKVIDENGKPRFKPYYYAGGFQGGTSKAFLEAMRTMKENIDKDFDKGYVAIWNDESHWNKYISDYKGELVVMSPSYVYPDSLVKEYYEPTWGCSYEPKIITLTKPFTLSMEGGDAINKFLKK